MYIIKNKERGGKRKERDGYYTQQCGLHEPGTVTLMP
jgi:hypothetical protein